MSNQFEEKEVVESSNNLIQQEAPEQEAPEQESTQPEQESSPKQSWKELREQAEQGLKYKKERDEYLSILQRVDYEQRYAQQQYQQPQEQVKEEPEFDFDSLDDDEILTAKELKKAKSQDKKRLEKLEESLKAYQRQNEEQIIETQLKSKYNDFYDVLTPQNIEALRQKRPGLARSLNLNPDLMEKAQETYQAIKDLGIHGSLPDSTSFDQVTAHKNSLKPKPINSISPQGGNSPLSHANAFANGLTKDLKASLWKEMQEKSRS